MDLADLSANTQVLCLCASLFLSLLGFLPLWLLPLQSRYDQSGTILRCLLCLAVGSLLGDVFLHILPEATALAHKSSQGAAIGAGHSHLADLTVGGFLLLGLLAFFLVDKITRFAESSETNEASDRTDEKRKSHSTALLTLIANSLDNFSHGLAVAAAFSLSPKVGLTTTAAIAIHELPHEVGDFAILVDSGFNKNQAIFWQFMTSVVGPIGTATGLLVQEQMNMTNFLLPFTAGCFLYVALSSLLPSLITPTPGVHWFVEVVLLVTGSLLVSLVADE